MGQAASRPPTAGTYRRQEEEARPIDTRYCACLPLLLVPPAPRVKGWAKRHRASPSSATPQESFVSTGSGDGDADTGAAGSRCIAGPTDIADGCGPDSGDASHGEREVDASSPGAEGPEVVSTSRSATAVAAAPVSCMTGPLDAAVPAPSLLHVDQGPSRRAVTLYVKGCNSSSAREVTALVGKTCGAAPTPANENAVSCVSKGSCDKSAAASTVLAADVNCPAKPWQVATSKGPTAEMIQAFLQQQRALIVLPIFHQRLLFIDDRRIFRRRPGTSQPRPPSPQLPSPVARVISYLGLDSLPAHSLPVYAAMPPPFDPPPARPGRPAVVSAMSVEAREATLRTDAMPFETRTAAAPQAYVVVPVQTQADQQLAMQVMGVVEGGAAAIHCCNEAAGPTNGTEEEVVAPPSQVSGAVVVKEESSGAATAAGPITSEQGTPRESLTAFLASVPADVDGLQELIYGCCTAVPGGKVSKAGVMAWWRDQLPRELQTHYARPYSTILLLVCRKRSLRMTRKRTCIHPLPDPAEVADMLGLLHTEALQLQMLLGLIDYSVCDRRFRRDEPAFTPKIVIASVGATILECSQFQRPVLDAFRSALLDDEVALREGFGPDVVDSMLEEVEANKAAKLQQQAQPTPPEPAVQEPEQEGQQQQAQQQQQQQQQAQEQEKQQEEKQCHPQQAQEEKQPELQQPQQVAPQQPLHHHQQQQEPQPPQQEPQPLQQRQQLEQPPLQQLQQQQQQPSQQKQQPLQPSLQQPRQPLQQQQPLQQAPPGQQQQPQRTWVQAVQQQPQPPPVRAQPPPTQQQQQQQHYHQAQRPPAYNNHHHQQTHQQRQVGGRDNYPVAANNWQAAQPSVYSQQQPQQQQRNSPMRGHQPSGGVPVPLDPSDCVISFSTDRRDPNNRRVRFNTNLQRPQPQQASRPPSRRQAHEEWAGRRRVVIPDKDTQTQRRRNR